MKLIPRRLFAACLGLSFCLLGACQSNQVVVVDSRTKKPVPGATVYQKTGNVRTQRHVTNVCGTTEKPRLPQGWRGQTVVSKPGYRTTTYY